MAPFFDGPNCEKTILKTMRRRAQYTSAIGLGCCRVVLSTSEPIADTETAKPKNDAPTDDYQSKRVFVRVSEIKPDDNPACDHDHSDA